MHSAGLELTKLTYTRLEDNLIRHPGDRLLFICSCFTLLLLLLVQAQQHAAAVSEYRV